MNTGSCTCGQKESLIHLLFVISRFLFSIAMVYFTVLQVSRLQRTGLGSTGRTSLRLLVIGRSGGGSWGVTHVAAEGLEVVFEQCYCWWKKSGWPVEVGSLSHCLQSFLHPRWCRISAIHNRTLKFQKTWQPCTGVLKTVLAGRGGRVVQKNAMACASADWVHVKLL